MTSQWIDAGGARLFVQVVGSGSPVVLINGIGANHAMWDPLVHALDGFEVITFDAPGIGRSRGAVPFLGVPALARLVRELLTELGRERVDVLGYSFGGTVAQELARQAPETVRRLVLVGSTCGWGGVPGSPGALAVLSMPLRYYSRSFYLATAGLLAGGQAERDEEFVRRAAEARLRYPPTLAGYAAQLTAVASWTSLPWLHRLQQPTLVVQGEDDPVSPAANGMLLAHRIPNARLRLQRREGHFLLLDPASSAGPAVADFLDVEDHEASTAWQEAEVVEADALAASIAATRDSAQPLATINSWLRDALACPGGPGR